MRRAVPRGTGWWLSAPTLPKLLLGPTAHILPSISHLFAGKTTAPARWYIKGMTGQRPQRFVPGGKRHSMKLAVFIQLGRKPIVVVASQHSPGQNKQAAGRSSTVTSNTNIAWSGERYCEVVQQALLGGGGASGGERHKTPLKLVHDRDSCHTSQAFRTFARNNKIDLVELPAKSPDLDPLDYGVFGSVKRAWEKEVWANKLGWTAQWQLLVKLLKEKNTDASIASFPSRIQNCKEAEGWHFE